MAINKVYIAGPMSGVPQFNYPAFDEAAGYIRGMGYEAISPAEMDDPHIREAALASETGNFREFDELLKGEDHEPETWGDFLSRDVKLIADEVDAVALLDGWENSRGARLEAFVALSVQKPVFRFRGDVLEGTDPTAIMGTITACIIEQGDVTRYG
jgi:hypothetical protein